MAENRPDKLRSYAAAAIAAVMVALAAPPLVAKEAAPLADNPALEQRLNALTENLRCLVCQNQSIADSHAELAIDLKNQIREMMAQGRSDAQIVDFLVQRYGDYVLFRPPMKPATALLWAGPFLLLLAGTLMLLRGVARNRALGEEQGKEGGK
ncbi:MAG TPA: cytochrome c-type biogenesis protein [Rhodocyclaceae bacterium]